MQLASYCLEHHGQPGETAYLFPTSKTATECQSFLAERQPPILSRVQFISLRTDTQQTESESRSLYACFLPQDATSAGKQYWQHTGAGISSRYAERCLALLDRASSTSAQQPVRTFSTANARSSSSSSRGLARNKHYKRSPALDSILSPSSNTSSAPASPAATPGIDEDQDVEETPRAYVEERYGRNLAGTLGPLAKAALRRRIAGVLREQHVTPSPSKQDQPSPSLTLEHLSLDDEEPVLTKSGGMAVNGATSTRGVINLSADDVYLYPGGMNAIYQAHQLMLQCAIRAGKTPGKSICFGFPYTDTLKILEKWGPGCHFFGSGLDDDLDKLDQLLDSEREKGAPEPLALFTEFPSNPLLRCANLPRLKQLSQKHGFALVVDETIGTFANVEVLPWCDIAVSSLTKVFSGDSNVMGGSMVLNPDSKFYTDLKMLQARVYEDIYFDEDAIFLERNSRNFMPRIERIDLNTEMLCDYFWDHLYSPANESVADVYYTKFSTPENYLRCLRGQSDGMPQRAGYGGLFSLAFRSDEASRAFYDALACEKGPSLGTNFTLACPYTILAHWSELDWAAGWGVPARLVRVSVGLEDGETLLKWFKAALDAAEAVSR